MMNQFGSHGGIMGWGWIFGLILLVVVIWIIVRSINQNNIKRNERTSPLDILKERYAKGEINKEEFEQTKKDLM